MSTGRALTDRYLQKIRGKQFRRVSRQLYSIASWSKHCLTPCPPHPQHSLLGIGISSRKYSVQALLDMWDFDGSMQTWFFSSEESCCLVSSQVFQYMRLRGKSIRQALACLLRDLASRQAGGASVPQVPICCHCASLCNLFRPRSAIYYQWSR